jgi:hypothetical protein
MMAGMKYRWLVTCLLMLVVWLAPVSALAAKEDEDTARQEARYEGYPTVVKMANPGGTGLAWAMVCFLSVLTIACLFKNAKRTHLD